MNVSPTCRFLSLSLSPFFRDRIFLATASPYRLDLRLPTPSLLTTLSHSVFSLFLPLFSCQAFLRWRPSRLFLFASYINVQLQSYTYMRLPWPRWNAAIHTLLLDQGRKRSESERKRERVRSRSRLKPRTTRRLLAPKAIRSKANEGKKK